MERVKGWEGGFGIDRSKMERWSHGGKGRGRERDRWRECKEGRESFLHSLLFINYNHY